MSDDVPKVKRLYFFQNDNGIGVLKKSSNGKMYMVFTEDYVRNSEEIGGTMTESFRKRDPLSSHSVMKYYGDKIISSDYGFKGDTHPRDVGLDKIDVLGSGVHGNFRDAPDVIDIGLRKTFHIKGPLALSFLEKLTVRTNKILTSLVENEGEMDGNITALSTGWSIFLMSGYDDKDFVMVSPEELKEWIMWWYETYFLRQTERQNKFRLPKHYIPAFINVVMYKRGYKSIASYCNRVVIYPPYSKDSKIIFDHN